MPYLFFLSALEIAPLLGHMAKIHGVHRNFELSDDVVLGEAIKVIQERSLTSVQCAESL